MYALVGLGNPGQKYYYTRHSVGVRFIDHIVKKYNLVYSNLSHSYIAELITSNGTKILLAKSNSYMNESALPVLEIKNFYKLKEHNIYIVFDDLDLPQGKFKIQRGKYPKSHNGIKSIINFLNPRELNFVRIGIESRLQRNQIPGHVFVLQEYNLESDKIFTKLEEDLFKILYDLDL